MFSFAFLVLLGGCASLPEQGADSGMPADGLTCADVSRHATLADGATARGYAETAVLHQLQEVRSEMMAAGFYRMRIEVRPTQCVPFKGFGGEIHCKATASVCGTQRPARPLKVL
jgi:hypothetical protein